MNSFDAMGLSSAAHAVFVSINHFDIFFYLFFTDDCCIRIAFAAFLFVLFFVTGVCFLFFCGIAGCVFSHRIKNYYFIYFYMLA